MGGFDDLPSKGRVATILSCSSTLTNTILGAGVLGLPYAVSKSGFIVGPLLLAVACVFSSFGLHLLSVCAAKDDGNSSFYSVAHTALPAFTTLIDFIVAIKCFGVATSYLIIIGGTAVDMMTYWNIATDRRVWIACSLVVIGPLVCLRQLNSLRYTSLFSLLFVLLLSLLIILYSFNFPFMMPCDDTFIPTPDLETCQGGHELVTTLDGTLNVFTIFVFAFTCQQNIFSIVNEIENHSQNRVNKVIAISIGISMTLNMAVSIAGYSAYGSSVQSNILHNLPENVIVTLARGFVCILMLFTYPLQCHPSRKCIISLVKTVQNKFQNSRVTSMKKSKDEDYEVLNEEAGEGVILREKTDKETDEVSNFVYYGITIIFVVASFSLAMVVTDLGLVLKVVGATGSTGVTYLLPGLIYYFTFTHKHIKRYFALLQAMIGFIIIPVALYVIFKN